MANDYDVIIIGSGAGGGTLAYRLAPSGLRVLLLERGDYVRREIENWDSREVFGKARYKTKEEWICKDGTVFHPGQHYYVGGQTKFYGAILFRLRERDFGEVRHHGGVSPAWPSRTPTSSRTTRRRSASTTCTAKRAPTRPRRRAPAPFRTRP